ncbi:MAG: hypothetical protein U9P49_12815 [Thermodesulfobacteriota bacterium]|nr:hypothetical protein [Thermodesulfobacteriota bacterium]
MGKEHDLVLAIDSGTQNVKAAVFDLNGKELALSRLSHVSWKQAWEEDSSP